LLAAILRQNPDMHAAVTSPVCAMYMALEGAMSRRNETALFIDGTQRRDLLRGIFEAYYNEISATRLIFDTNRVWCTKQPALAELFPSARTICCVRNVSWIMDSLERLVRRNSFELSGLFGFDPGSTVYTRVNRWAASDGLVGYALDALKGAYFGEQASRLLLVEYEALASQPAHLTKATNYRPDGDRSARAVAARSAKIVAARTINRAGAARRVAPISRQHRARCSLGISCRCEPT
jgi:sulfotransferase